MDHAILSPSSAARWLACTPSARLEALLPDTAGEAAAEGTLAHAMAEAHLRYLSDMMDAKDDAQMDALAAAREVQKSTFATHELYSPEMEAHTSAYASYVVGLLEEARQDTPDAFMSVETRLDLTHYIPEAFGTSDAVIIADGVMHVVDFKYGKGVSVPADHNPQIMIYALGALRLYSPLYDINEVVMHIFQPRLDNTSSWRRSRVDLQAWGDGTLIPLARKAFVGAGDYVTGEWCRFCKARIRCREQMATVMEVADLAPTHPDLLAADDLAKVLRMAPEIKRWLTSVEDYALRQALSGVPFAGFKIVEGRSLRRFTDNDAVIARLVEAGVDEEEIYAPRSLRSVSDMERFLGKKRFRELLGACVEKPQGAPTLVAANDKRPAIGPGPDYSAVSAELDALMEQKD